MHAQRATRDTNLQRELRRREDNGAVDQTPGSQEEERRSCQPVTVVRVIQCTYEELKVCSQSRSLTSRSGLHSAMTLAAPLALRCTS